MLEITALAEGRSEVLTPPTTTAHHVAAPLEFRAPGISGVKIVSGPDGATLKGFVVTFASPGRYGIKIDTLIFGAGVIEVVVYETAALAEIPEMCRSGGAAVDKPRLLKSLAMYEPSFTGLAMQVRTAPLQNHGA
jgi:hypothetical protein